MKFLANKKLIALTLIMFAAPISVAAQDIAAVRRAIVQTGSNNVYFNIDSTGSGTMIEQNNLQITRLDDSGSFVGFYHHSTEPRPASTNVAGSITIVRARAGAITGNAIGISFTVSTRGAVLRPRTSALINTTTYEGAIRLGRSPNPTFMAGTYTISNIATQGIVAAPGPFPFCAMLKLRAE